MDKSNDGFSKGTQVRVVNAPDRIGVIIDDKPSIRGSRRRYKVQIQGSIERISEDGSDRGERPHRKTARIGLRRRGDEAAGGLDGPRLPLSRRVRFSWGFIP